MNTRSILAGLGLLSAMAVSQVACGSNPADDSSQSGAAASTVAEDQPAVRKAQLDCLKCAFNALYVAVALYVGGDGVAGAASSKYGVIYSQLSHIEALLANGEDAVDFNYVSSEINSVFQGILLAAKQELVDQGLSDALLGRIQGLLNVVTTIAQCGVAIFNGSVVLVDTSIAAYNEVRDALAFDITQKLQNDSADVAQGRQCVANTTFWSTSSYFDQCASCCDDNAGGRTGCYAVCNAEYKSTGLFN